MKSSTRNLIIVAAGIAVLGGVTAALALTGTETEGTSSAGSAASVRLVSKKSSDVVSMTVKNKKGGFTLIPDEAFPSSQAASAASASSAAEPTFTVQGLSGVPIDTSAAAQTVEDGFSLTAEKNFGKVENLDEYGLKDPQASVEVRFRDGSVYSYRIGDPDAADSSSRYMCPEGSDNVYVVKTDAGLLEGKNYFVSKNVLSLSPSNGQDSFTKIALSGKNYPQSVVMEKKASAQEITSPVHAPVDAEKFSALASALQSLTATSVEAMEPNAAALKQYGLDAPAAAVSFTVDGKNYKLKLGAQKDSGFYAMLDGVGVVYLVPGSGVESWAQADVFALRSKTLLTPGLTAVKQITVTQGSETSSVTVAREKDTKNSSSGSTAYTYKVTGAGGKALDYETNYQNFFDKLIGLSILEPAQGSPEKAPA